VLSRGASITTTIARQMTSSANRPQKSTSNAVPISSAATGIAGVAAGAALGWKALEVGAGKSSEPTEASAVDQETATTTHQGSLHGLSGTEVREEHEIPAVLDTAEEAGATHEDLMRFEALIRHNVQQGVAVVFGTEYGTGTMGQYDPENNFILITPETVDMGLEDTMKTLLHETVHAQQDMADGLDNETMQSLGLEINAEGVEYVEDNYTGLSQENTIIELESNSSEYNVGETFEELEIHI
jgi:hypothetical protein